MSYLAQFKRTTEERGDPPRFLLGAIVVGLLVIAILWASVSRFSNRRRLRNLYLVKAEALIQHDAFDEATIALMKASDADPRDTTIKTELLKARIFKIATKYDQLDRLVNLQELDSAQSECE